MKVNGQSPDYSAIAADPKTRWMLSPTVCICGCPLGLHGTNGNGRCRSYLKAEYLEYRNLGPIQGVDQFGGKQCECMQHVSQVEYFRGK